MRYIKIGSDEKLYFQAKNNSGGIVDLTSAEITFKIKTNLSDTTYLVRKRDTNAGGGDTEVKVTSAANGLFTVFLDKANTQSLTAGIKFITVLISISDDDYVIQEPVYLRDSGNASGSETAVQEVDYNYARFTIPTGESPTITKDYDNSGFAGTLAATVNAGVIEISSTSADFTLGKTFIETTFSYFTPDGWTDTTTLIKLQPYGTYQPGSITVRVFE